MSKIVYVCYYSTEKNPRHISPAGVTLGGYVIDSISRLGKALTVFSPAQSITGCEIERQIEPLNDKATAIFMKCFKKYGRKNLPMRFIQKIKRERELEKELDSLIENGDTVIVYHSLSLMNVITKLRKKKSFKLILQVAEIYADVINKEHIKAKELKYFSVADKYIFSSNLLESELNAEKKPSAICLGTYKTPGVIANHPQDGTIHILYAGTLDPRKVGDAISVATDLDEKYHLHILGFGTDDQVKRIREEIDNAKLRTRCGITYDGCLLGEEYIKFVQSCHIGLSPQDPNASFNATSFPSKILVYLANGLRVVSVKIPAIENSPVGKAMYFYENCDSASIAEVIKSIDLNKDYDSKRLINDLDKEFVQNIDRLLKE